MKALELIAASTFDLVEMPTPEPGPDDLLVAVRACGICGSDIHGMDGSSGRRIPPLVMGHEASGVVEGWGSGVTGWSGGDRVTFDSTIYCGQCHYCQSGHVNLCEDREVLGVSTPDFRVNLLNRENLTAPGRGFGQHLSLVARASSKASTAARE